MRLEGKNAVITGAGSGVGRASALRFAEEGARVVCADLNDGTAKETVSLIEATGGTAVSLGVDVSQEDDIVTMLDVAVEQFGKLDIVYNNVGIPTPRLGMVFEDHTLEDFQRLIAVNLGSVFLGSKHAILRFKEQGDRRRHPQHRFCGRPRRLGRCRLRRDEGWRASLDQGSRYRGSAVRDSCERHLPSRNALYRFSRCGGMAAAPELLQQVSAQVGSSHPLGKPSPQRTAPRRPSSYAATKPSTSPACCLPVDGGYVAR